MNRILFILAALATAVPAAFAQLDVDLRLERTVYLQGEPIEATVTIRNLAGKDIVLSDQPGNQWFSFEITRETVPVGPYDANYRNANGTILNNETVERKLNLLQLYPVNELGSYKVRATVYFAELKKFLVSEALPIEISEGKITWNRTVGVPDTKDGAGGYREMKLISFQLPKERGLYVRITDQASGAILCTYPLGPLLAGGSPMVEFDDNNTLFVFHMTGPENFALSKIGVNGEWLGQTPYLRNTPGSRTNIRKKPDGSMVVVGAHRDRSKEAGAPVIPKLSDRPVALPPPTPAR